MSKEKPSYWAVLPASVRYDAALPPNAKLLYAEISSLADRAGYCFASNEYFAKNFELNMKSIQRLIKALVDQKYISVDVLRDPETKAVIERRIYVGINPAGQFAPHSPQNCGDPSPQKSGDTSPQNCGIEQSNGFNNNPHTPKRGQRKRKEPREAPDWLPERFDGFWKFYPKAGRKDKQRAMDAWDSLHPSEDLIATIGRALIKQKATDEWKRGIGIPHAATYLNGSRWLDAEELDDPANAPPSGGWADDEEVL